MWWQEIPVGADSRRHAHPPVPTWCTDLTLAFAALNPQTTGLAARGDTAWLVHAPFNDEQRVIWAYFVEDDTPVTAPDPPQRVQWAHERERAEQHALYAHRSARVVNVAARLHRSAATTERLLSAAIGKLARAVNWDEDVAAARCG